MSSRLRNAIRIFHQQGLGSLLNIAGQHAAVQTYFLSHKAAQSIDIDGCAFNIGGIPNTSMKLSLVRGNYERFERMAVRKFVDLGHPVIELGGCIGVVACITNRLLTNPTAHIVVEANPFVVPLLEENRVRNDCHFEIVNAAIAYGVESIAFTPARDWWINSVRQVREGEAKVVVGTTSLRALIEKHKFESFTLICDIEGHEFDLLLNEESAIKQAGTLIIETHPHIIGEAKTAHMLTRIQEIGFRIVDQGANVFVMTRLP